MAESWPNQYEVFRREHLAFMSNDYDTARQFAEMLSLWHKDWKCPSAGLTRLEQGGKVLAMFNRGEEVSKI